MLNDTAAFSQIRLLIASGEALAQHLRTAMAQSALRPIRPACVGDGVAAEQALRANRFDIVMLGLNLFAKTGAEAGIARLVRFSQGALVLALSDAASVSDGLAALRGGAHDCLALPVAPDALAERLGKLAQRHAGPGPLIALAPRPEPEPRSPVHLLPASRPGAESIEPMWRQEQKIIEQAVALCGGNIARAAAALEISPSTIYRKRQGWQDMQDSADGWAGANLISGAA